MTEQQSASRGITDDAVQDDVEGHGIRGRGFSDATQEGFRAPQPSTDAATPDDDVEGHGVRIKI